ncbi:MAG: Mov34/MPN/PAD-1 family protein [Thermoanaerobaculia bacterium]
MRIWLSLGDQAALLRAAELASPNETGGALLGFRGDGGGLVVTAIVGPGPRAVHEPTRFVPDHVHHEEEIARHYAESGRLHVYLGDWHSHPGGSCALSRADRRTLGRIARTADARMPHPIMLIVGGSGDHWRIVVHRYAKRSMFRFTHRLELVHFS